VSRGENAVRENAMRGPAPRALEFEIPRLERGAVPMRVGKPRNNRPRVGLGFRVWKPKVSKANREKLKALYNDVINYLLGVASELEGSKYLTYYADEWKKMFEEVKEARVRAGKRTLPKTPPLPLLVKFVMPDGQERGNKNAPAVIDLKRGELRISSYGVVQRLRRSLVRALIEENLLEPRPEFTLQITRRGLIRVVAHRRLRARLELPLRIVAIDENSRHGHSTATWYISETKVAMTHFEKMRPINHGFRREVAALLQSFADKPCEETKKQLAKFLPPKVLKTLTSERAGELVEKTREKEKRLNSDFVSNLIAKVRSVVREAVRRGMSALILVEPVNADSLRGTELQGTLLRGRKLLRNLAVYEGAKVGKVSASGKICPRCGTKGVEIVHTKRSRIYECPKCGLRWDRDKGVHYNMVYSYFARMVKEECDDDTVMAERVLAALREWLEKHPNILAY
jgi:ribosomal protein S27AE